jgi:serine/threonine-protein kinase RsbW
VSLVRESSESRPRGNAVELELPGSQAFNAVGRLVVGGLASRLDFPVEEIEDLQLAVEALLCRSAAAESVTVALYESERGLQARLGPFAADPDERASMERTLRALVDDADVQESSEGEWIVVSARRDRATRRSP